MSVQEQAKREAEEAAKRAAAAAPKPGTPTNADSSSRILWVLSRRAFSSLGRSYRGGSREETGVSHSARGILNRRLFL